MPLHRSIDTLPASPRRLISLVPSLTETIAELGAAPRLVGVTDWCWYPKDIVEPLPKIGGTKNPKRDLIRALNPDLIIVNEEENRRSDVETLAEEFDCWVTFPKGVDDNAGLIRDLGLLTGTESRADDYLAQIDELTGRLRARLDSKPSRSMAYLIWQKPWMTINRDTYVHDVLTFLHLTNPWADSPDRYPTLTDQQLTEADPDLICLSSEPFPFEPSHLAEFRATFPALRAVRPGPGSGTGPDSLFIEDGTYFCWYGSRWVRALDYFVHACPWL